ncbi:hypothetical protein QCA50_018542 [Cerrena zonata]|uniref:G3BP-like protein n=1 Tax=Cerrena zonata TaxID=2478898 RepID=A0AAW0FGR5_9APHY
MTNTTSAVNPSEVGWQFVPQYYTFVNKQPGRLHCFYTKASTFIHGTEGEDGKPCFGQLEIHEKITSIGFQDCKVFIHSVDAQSSANGGIIIQVIGEMSNNGEPWRKFVQTFFLAEQPNGYFVLNDIFRFLKEETVEEDQTSEFDGSQAQDAPVVQEPAPPAPVTPAPPPPVEPEPEPIRAPSPPPSAPVEEESAPEPEPQPETNGIHEQATEPAPEPEPAAPAAPEPVATASPPPVSPVAAPQPLAPSPAPPAQPQPAQQPEPTPAPQPQQAPPQPAAPPKPKSWASLAASGSNKWGSVAQESRGISEVPASSSSPAPPSPAPHARPTGNQSPAFHTASAVNTAECFVKGVIESVTDAAVKGALQRFGPIKEIQIVRSKACAFVEFNTVDSARRAIIASLPVNMGGEGGLRVGTPQEGHLRLSVETRKERGDRPPPRGPPVNGGGERRGNFRGRGAPGGGRGRGAGPAK